MVAHEESIIRRDDALVEDRERRLELRRTRRHLNERPLLRIFHERALAVAEWQLDGVCRHGGKRESRCSERDRAYSVLEHVPSCRHERPPDLFFLNSREWTK